MQSKRVCVKGKQKTTLSNSKKTNNQLYKGYKETKNKIQILCFTHENSNIKWIGS